MAKRERPRGSSQEDHAQRRDLSKRASAIPAGNKPRRVGHTDCGHTQGKGEDDR